jgi:predicted transcriptional regulator
MKEPELLLLSQVQETLKQSPKASQRDIAKAVNMSLGMTNSLLKRFAEKGWLYMNKISTRNIQYVLTPDGMNELARRSYRYIKRTLKSVLDYKDIISSIIITEKTKGVERVFLVGKTDLQFIVEYACLHNKIPLIFVNTVNDLSSLDLSNSLVLISDSIQITPNDIPSSINSIHLYEVIIQA